MLTSKKILGIKYHWFALILIVIFLNVLGMYYFSKPYTLDEIAEKEAKEILEKAQNQIIAEREKAINEIKAVVVDFSIQAASKVIEKNLNSADNTRIINDAIEGIGKA